MKKRGGVSVDFSGVESGGRSVPEDDYVATVTSIEEKESSEGNPYLAWKWKIAEGPYKGVTIYDNTSLKSTALWRLKTLLECLGVDVTDGKMSLDLKEYIGKTCGIKVTNETYQGKERPRITEFLRSVSSASVGSSESSKFKKGQKVTFQYEEEEMEGTVSALSGDKVVVLVEIDGEKEEWELDSADLT
jgi:hypothetical protein